MVRIQGQVNGMWNILDLTIAFFISAAVALCITPLVKKIAMLFKAVDQSDNNDRKMHTGSKVSMGGLAIFIGVACGFLYLQPAHPQMTAIIIGACIMVATGMLDDMFDIRPIFKLSGQLAAAIVVVSSGLVIESVTVPFMGTVHFGHIGIVLTVVWIVAASNMINLIDGLDGLAAGVSAIAITSILVMGVMDYRVLVVSLCVLLIGSCAGFLFHNFYPSKIFMGDTGALFLGYAIAIISMLGLFKNIAFFSFVVPIIVIAIPVFDTVFAIVRRAINKQGIATADRKHIHYQLLEMGYSHRASVLIIYGFSVFFGGMAIIFNSATLLMSLVILAIIILGIQLIAEMAGITVYNRQPLLDGIRKVAGVSRNGRLK